MIRRRISFLVTVLLAIAAAPAFARLGGPPDWVIRAAKQPNPAEVGAASAVVLSNDTTVEIDRDGTATRTHRFVLRILTNEGRSLAATSVAYLQSGSTVRTATAWLIRNGREVKYSDRGDWVDGTVDTIGALYNESRFKATGFSNDAVTGDVFVAETEVSGPMLFSEDYYLWGCGELPVAEESYRLLLPADFSVVSFLHGEPAPIREQSADGREITWRLNGERYLPPEPIAPRYEAVHPFLLARIQPKPGIKHYKPAVLQQWGDLARWTEILNAAQCDRDARLIETAKRLTATCGSELEKIRALGAYVQGLPYAALLERLDKGLGIQPHKATLILGRGYGDCKDKSNLLCALLREIGVEAFIAAARAENDIAVCPEFPSAAQFNHAIVAIRVGPSVNFHAVVDSPQGRFLFFDPTSEHTVLGDLPFYLQGSLVFLQKTESETLIALPSIPPAEGHNFTRRAKVQVGADGGCTAHVTITGLGQAGMALRHEMFNASTDDALKRLARVHLAESLRAGSLQNVTKYDDLTTGVCSIALDVTKDNYCQLLRNSLVVVRPDVLARGSLPALTAPNRSLPIKLPAIAFDDEVDLVLANALRPSELPAPASFSSPYGSYSREFKIIDKTIRMCRRLELRSQVVPAAEYAALKKFLGEMAKADRSSVVLKNVSSEDGPTS